MIKYTLPDFTVGLSRNLFFIRLWRAHPEYFIDGLQLESVYGCFPDCILNGGRAFIRERYTDEQIEQTFALLRDENVVPRLTFTNMLAQPMHLEDDYVQDILQVTQKYHGEVIVYSDEIAELIKERYGLACILSTTRGIRDIDEVNQLTKKYDYVVLDYNLNKDYGFIKQIEDSEKIEIMVNEFCQYQCPHREEHYLHNSEDQMSGTMRTFECYHQDPGKFFDHSPDHPVFLTDTQVQELNQTFGINYFKIVGRGIHPETNLESYTYYLVKPQYREAIKQHARNV